MKGDTVIDYQKNKETWVWSLNIQYLFTTVQCKPHFMQGPWRQLQSVFHMWTFFRSSNYSNASICNYSLVQYLLVILRQSQSHTPWLKYLSQFTCYPHILKNLLDFAWLNRFLYFGVLKCQISAKRFFSHTFLLAGVCCIILIINHFSIIHSIINRNLKIYKPH